MAFFRVLLVTLCAATASLALPLPQRSGADNVFQAYSPGQYTSNAPRVVIAAGKHTQQQHLRSSQPQILKRVRVQPVLSKEQHQHQHQAQQQYYTLESPATYAQTVPVATAVRPQVQAQYQHQPQPTYIQQPTYYIQRSPTQPIAPLPQKAVLKSVVPKPQQLDEEPEEEYPSDLNPSYNFSFDVKDDELTNYQNRQEEREGGVTKGSYSVVDPDGYVRTVTYTADSKNGFQAKVTREPTGVKVKFPVPTPAPAEEQALYKHKAAPVVRSQQIAQYPQQQYRQAVYQHQPQPQEYAGSEEQTYVLRRVPGPGNNQRLVKVARQ